MTRWNIAEILNAWLNWLKIYKSISRSKDPGKDTVIVRWIFLIFIIFEINTYRVTGVSSVCGCFLLKVSSKEEGFFFFLYPILFAFEFLSGLLSSFFHHSPVSYHKNENSRAATRNERWMAIEALKNQRRTGFQRRGDAWCTDVHDIDIMWSVTISHKRGKVLKKRTKWKN